jgi:hypothetical protein
MRLSEQLELRSAIGKPEQALRKEIMEGFSKLVRDFIEQAELYFRFSFLKQNQKL